MTFPVLSAGTVSTGPFTISRSLRFRASASTYLQRSPETTGTDPLKFTVSGWMKRGLSTASYFPLLGSNTGSNAFDFIGFQGDNLAFRTRNSSAVDLTNIVSTAVYRDFSAWYHIVGVFDTANATSTERIKLYVNGVQVTSFGTATYPAQNTAPSGDFLTNMQIGRTNTNNVNQNYGDGYIAELNFIDGQALTPAYFGQINPTTGVWSPIRYTGTYGQNGFYLPFSDNSSTTPLGLGRDFSTDASGVTVSGSTVSGGNTVTVVAPNFIEVGNSITGPGIPTNTYVTAIVGLTITISQNATGTFNFQNYTFSGNNFTPNNFSLTAGATYDSMIDVPTQYDDGGTGRGNYAVLNPLDLGQTSALANGNLNFTTSSTTNYSVNRASFGVSSGKWYWEVTMAAATAANGLGIARNSASLNQYLGQNATGWGWQGSNGNIYNNGTFTAYGTTFTNGDVIGVALDMDAGTLTFYKNGVSAGVAWTGLSGEMFPAVSDMSSSTTANLNANFGQRPFSYTPPTGFKALNTQNLPTLTIPKGNQYFDATTYTGTGTTQVITNSGAMQPDLVWTKLTSLSAGHNLVDSVRGVTKALYSNLTNAETVDTLGLTAFNTNGFTLGGASGYNNSGATAVAWQWKKGATQGFDIVTYTGTGTNRTVAHNLGVAPSMIVTKNRTATGNWITYHVSLGAGASISLNSAGASSASATVWNNTAPTASVFSLGALGVPNISANDYVAYLFAEVAGFSKIGSYTGNGVVDGPFVYCGFQPRFIVFKNATTAATDWYVFDTSRNLYNLTNRDLRPNLPQAETTQLTTNQPVDLLSNGFKLRGSGSSGNGSGNTIIFAAFAENPFKYALAR